MAELDIFNPQVSVVAKGLEGKVILIYGGNSLGKTKQCSRMKNPLFLSFESGLNAIQGINYMNIQTWSDFKRVNKQLTSISTIDQAKKLYSTIIFDEVYASAQFCQEYICNKYKSPSIGEGNGGYGLWDKYESEYWREINRLVNAGYTVIFIAHEQELKDGTMYPKGDKRSINPIIDNCDIIMYLHSNGIDSDGKVIKSSGYLAEVPGMFFARSRFDYMVTKIDEFTAENLEAAIEEGIRKQEEAEGFSAVSFKTQKESKEVNKIPFNVLKEKVLELGGKVAEAGFVTELQDIVKDNLGADQLVADTTERQYESLELILDDLNILITNKEINI